jgi:hypothetical protein
LWTDENVKEYNILHKNSTDTRKTIVENLRTLKMGNLAWSPKLQRFYDKIELLKMIVRKKEGLRSSMTKIRRLVRITGAWNALKADLQGAKTMLGEAFQSYKEARTQAPEWRGEHLDELDKAKAIKNKSLQQKERKKRNIYDRKQEAQSQKSTLRQKTVLGWSVLQKLVWNRHVLLRMNGDSAKQKTPHQCKNTYWMK